MCYDDYLQAKRAEAAGDGRLMKILQQEEERSNRQIQEAFDREFKTNLMERILHGRRN